jgi:prevent-host-death family protein
VIRAERGPDEQAHLGRLHRAGCTGSSTTPTFGMKRNLILDPAVNTGHSFLVMSKKARGNRHIAAAEFKARCLELMDRVRETGAEYVITKHGTPVAKLVPVGKPASQPFFGSMKGTVLDYERPLDPLDDDYDVNRG